MTGLSFVTEIVASIPQVSEYPHLLMDIKYYDDRSYRAQSHGNGELQILCDLVIRPRHESTRLHRLSVYGLRSTLSAHMADCGNLNLVSTATC